MHEKNNSTVGLLNFDRVNQTYKYTNISYSMGKVSTMDQPTNPTQPSDPFIAVRK